MEMPKVWEILKRFMGSCKSHGWKTSESEDWVEADAKYHNFVWARGIHLTSFKRIASNRKCVIREGLSYHVAEASYTAWLFSESPSETLIRTVFETPDYSRSTAIYDLSPLLNGKSLCVKLNDTDSPVFQEFENFLKKELKLKIKSFAPVEPKTSDFTIAEMA
jgi:hypothetical protein